MFHVHIGVGDVSEFVTHSIYLFVDFSHSRAIIPIRRWHNVYRILYSIIDRRFVNKETANRRLRFELVYCDSRDTWRLQYVRTKNNPILKTATKSVPARGIRVNRTVAFRLTTNSLHTILFYVSNHDRFVFSLNITLNHQTRWLKTAAHESERDSFYSNVNFIRRLMLKRRVNPVWISKALLLCLNRTRKRWYTETTAIVYPNGGLNGNFFLFRYTGQSCALQSAAVRAIYIQKQSTRRIKSHDLNMYIVVCNNRLRSMTFVFLGNTCVGRSDLSKRIHIFRVLWESRASLVASRPFSTTPPVACEVS